MAQVGASLNFQKLKFFRYAVTIVRKIIKITLREVSRREKVRLENRFFSTGSIKMTLLGNFSKTNFFGKMSQVPKKGQNAFFEPKTFLKVKRVKDATTHDLANFL